MLCARVQDNLAQEAAGWSSGCPCRLRMRGSSFYGCTHGGDESRMERASLHGGRQLSEGIRFGNARLHLASLEGSHIFEYFCDCTMNRQGSFAWIAAAAHFRLDVEWSKAIRLAQSSLNASSEKKIRKLKAKWGSKKWGLQIGFGHETVTNLRLVDGILIIGRLRKEVLQLLRGLELEAGRDGLRIYNGIGNRGADAAKVVGYDIGNRGSRGRLTRRARRRDQTPNL